MSDQTEQQVSLLARTQSELMQTLLTRVGVTEDNIAEYSLVKMGDNYLDADVLHQGKVVGRLRTVLDGEVYRITAEVVDD